jgi:hypothetical protein
MLKRIFCTGIFKATVLLLLAAPSALAVTFIVDSTADLPDTNPTSGTCHTTANSCTLRAAVMQANHATAPSAIIMLPAGIYNLTIPATAADGDDNGDLNLTTPPNGFTTITISGAGASTTIIDANQNDRVLRVHDLRTATISGVTTRNGFTGMGSGGGIINQGSLTVSNSIISENHGGDGAGIFNSGSLSVVNSTIRNNSGRDGGGIFNEGTVVFTNSTISGNGGASGGGVFNELTGTLYIINSTITQNNVNFDGGGIFNFGNLFMVNSTVTLNAADNNGGGIYYGGGTANIYNTSIVFNGADADANGGTGGGVYNATVGAHVNLRNSLLAGNIVANAPIADDCTGAFTVYGRNLFGDVTGCTISKATGGNWALYGSLNTLGPLQNNGGPTSTVALLAGSNAIDGGDPAAGCIDYNGAVIPTDQRGMPRVVGVRCDIGAYEFAPGGTTPTFQSAASHRVHGGAGTFDLALSATPLNPTTEPRQGPAQTIIFTFNKPISAATATVTEGIATAGTPTFSGNDVIVGLTGVNNQQYVTIALTNVASVDGGTGGSGNIRIGFLLGDVNQNRVVTVADLGLVNAQLAQTVTAANYLKDVNASGTLTVADKGIANANLTKALPAP